MELTLPSHNSLLGDLSGLDTWLAGMGVPARSSDRIHQLIELLRHLKPLGPALTVAREEQRQYMYGLAELVEFHQIFTWLRQENPALLRPKLIRCLSGSLDPADERSDNNVGRNTIFELSVASEWRRAGLDVAIGEPDLLILGPQEFVVECKRPFDWTGIVRCVKDATRQLDWVCHRRLSLSARLPSRSASTETDLHVSDVVGTCSGGEEQVGRGLNRPSRSQAIAG